MNDTLRDGLFPERIGNGWQIRCRRCGNTVDVQHVPDSDDCKEARRERAIAQAD